MLAKTKVDQIIWMKCNALPKNACSCVLKELNQCPCMFQISFKPNYMFFPSFGPLILVGLQQTMKLPSLMPIFAGNAYLYSSCMF